MILWMTVILEPVSRKISQDISVLAQFWNAVLLNILGISINGNDTFRFLCSALTVEQTQTQRHTLFVLPAVLCCWNTTNPAHIHPETGMDSYIRWISLFLRMSNAHLSRTIHDSVTDDAHTGLYWYRRGRKDCWKQWEDRTGKCEQTAWIAKGGRRTMAYHSQTDTHTDTHSSEPLKTYLCNELPALSKAHE